MKDERETKEKLLQSARAEFLAKGYQGASLRSICKASGVTTGALYFFFKDKDDLFTSLVAPQLNTLKAMLTEHMRQELLVLDSGEDAAENDFRDDAYASQQVLHLLYQNYDLFLLLLTGSYGSSLEHFVDELVAISEEHYRKLADRQAALLGVTATPNRGDKLPLVHLFDNYYQITSRFLIDSHYLVRPRFLDLSPVFETDKGTEKGHLAKNCKNDIEGTEIIHRLCDSYLAHKEPGKSIIFAPSHEFCEKIYHRLKELGRTPAYLGLGLDDAARKAELEKFEKGGSEELINVDICTEGYDFPPLRNLVDFDTNGTHGQWVQKVGRVLRTAPGKVTCTVIDFGGNIEMYPDGVETDVALDGAVKKKRGKRLTEDDLFRQREEKSTAEMLYQDTEKYTPYHLPTGFESVLDRDFGIVFVACGAQNDCIIVPCNDLYNLYVGDKKSMREELCGDFDLCMKRALEIVDGIVPSERGISNLQIKLLAPEYPTTALNWYGANCCICWKTWKDVIKGGGCG